jgi:hypothetical protein
VRPPSPPYCRGQFSTGEAWARRFAADFTDRGLPAFNVAFGGARALSDDDRIPDLHDRLDTALDRLPRGGPGPSGALIVQMCANDLLDALSTRRDLVTAGFDAANAVAAAAPVTLKRDRVTSATLLNMPKLGRTPLLASDPVTSAAGEILSRTFNRTLEVRAAQMRKAGLDARILDLNAGSPPSWTGPSTSASRM